MQNLIATTTVIFFFLFVVHTSCSPADADEKRSESTTTSTKLQQRCFSCASENMRENFLTRPRGPHPRIGEPKVYDDMCDLDTWLVRERGAADCSGVCFKWQQIFNNSGIFSYATIRGCLPEMLNIDKVNLPLANATSAPHSECNSSEVQLGDPRLDHSTIIEALCWCQGDFCNSAERFVPGILAPLILQILICATLVPLIIIGHT